jgi:hypothetical protein
MNDMDKLKSALIVAALILIGAITEAIVAWVNYLGNQAGV